jgi:hypothetical protein
MNCPFAVQFDRKAGGINVQLQAMFVVFAVKLAGQFVVVLHVYHVLVAVILLHTSQ